MLKPCPFCGSKNILKGAWDELFCANCETSVYLLKDDKYDSLKQKWNTRVEVKDAKTE